MNKFSIIFWLLCLSCNHTDSIEAYTGGRWEKDSAIFPGLDGRKAPISFQTNDTLFYGFGHDYVPLTPPVFNDLYYFTKQKWIQLPDFPGQFRIGAVIFRLNHQIYCGLGTNERAIRLGKRFRDLWVYNQIELQWDSLKMEFPGEERTDALLFESQGKMYYGAGIGKTGVLNDMYIFDPKNGWEQADPFYIDRQAGATVFNLNHEIYACFGKDDKGYLYTFRKFNPENGWHSVYLLKENERATMARTNAQVFVLKEKEEEYAYILGGQRMSGISEEEFWSCLRYNPRTNILEKVNTPDCKKIEAAFSIENTGYIFDGKHIWKF
ncbi:MAG: hypothetical protein K2L23_07455, partial [Odoribacter sp.]|nr:hypothetical protein [Odoribacter sp.]